MIRALPVAVLMIAASPAFAQLGGSTAGATGGLSGASQAGTLSGAGGLSSSAIGRPPAPLGSIATLSERIDAAARISPASRPGAAVTLDTRAGGGALGGSLGISGSNASAINSAGRPAGQPLGTASNTIGTGFSNPFAPR